MPGPNFPIHFRPDTSRLADTIPFYWNGEYHIFYLLASEHVTWEHIVSKDLIHWTELPTALRAGGVPDGPDGGHMFTGSVIEKDGVFHIFYTGHNPSNPRGLEFVMHATSLDLIHWTKHPEDMIAPDGVIYKNDDQKRDFRDPYVFANQEEGAYWMVLLADDAKTGQTVQGLAVSKDLKSWELRKPLQAPVGQECPDLFKIGDIWYLIGADRYLWSKSAHGPYREAVNPFIDRPFIYAAKRMFDGRRHVWTGWLWDKVPENDSGQGQWGGTQCLPRELYAGPDGELYCKPVDEVEPVFGRTVLDIARSREIGSSEFAFDVPDDYLMVCKLTLDHEAKLTLTMRETDDSGYRLVLEPKKQEASISGPGFNCPRRIVLDTAKPIEIKAFVQGSMIETFINDQYALSCRAYDHPSGRLGFGVTGGRAKLSDLRVRVP